MHFRPTFGKVIELTREGYLDAVDKENSQVPVVIHIYEKVGMRGFYFSARLFC